jgi:hypothetical protein
MTAVDSFYSSDTGQVHAGQDFEVDDAKGQEFAARGLATMTGPAPDAEPDAEPVPPPGPETEPAEPEEPEDAPDLDDLPDEPEPETTAKAEPPPKNKAAPRAKTKAAPVGG